MSLRVLPDPPEDGDDSLHDEVEAMFKDEARKHKSEARPTRKIPPGYYDGKDYSDDEKSHGLTDFHRELFEVRRARYPQKKRKGKK